MHLYETADEARRLRKERSALAVRVLIVGRLLQPRVVEVTHLLGHLQIDPQDVLNGEVVQRCHSALKAYPLVGDGGDVAWPSRPSTPDDRGLMEVMEVIAFSQLSSRGNGVAVVEGPATQVLASRTG